MDLSGNNPEHWEKHFLREIADEYGFSGDTLIAFLARFKRKNKKFINSELAKDIAWNRFDDDGNKEQKLEEELQNIYSALQTNCPNLGKRKPGRPRKEEEPWLIVYNWLWNERVNELKTQNTAIPDKQEQKATVCSFLQQIENEFQHIHLFHTQQPIVLKDQYIPIQVTLERKYTHTIETTWSYAESEDEIKRVYSRKNLEASKPTQVDWQEAKKQHRCMMVLADPGMGKTTLLKREAYLIAKEERLSLEDNSKKIEDVIIPVFLTLSEIADLTKDATAKLIEVIPKLIEAKYDKYFPEIKAVLEEKIKTGKCVLLFDALDEVPKEKHQRLSDKLNDFLNNYPNLIICTSRIVGYSGTFLANIKHVEIVPFTQKQTNEYIQIWFKNAVEYINDDSVSAASLIRELQNKPQIRELAQNPLLLSLICSLYQEKGLTLPARRCEVYKQAVKFMLGKWRKARNQELDDSWVDTKIELLEQIAYEFSCDNQEIFTLRELRSKIDKFLKGDNISSDFQNKNPSVLITELAEQDGILQKVHENSEQYLFLHRTFQEYLTACYLQNSTDGVELAKAHFWDLEWHEILSLMAGLMNNPLPLLQTILGEKDDIFSTQLLLAGRCAAECQSISHPLIEEIINRIYDFWCRYLDIDFVQSVVAILGQAHSQMFEKLLTNMSSKNDYIRGGMALALGMIGTPQALDTLIQIINDDNESDEDEWYVKWSAVLSLGKMSNPKALDVLINKALINKHVYVRGSAAWALGEISSMEALDALINILNDKDGGVRKAAISALAKINLVKVESFLIKLALNDEEWYVRKEALSILVKHNNPEVLNLLITEARNHQESYVREEVSLALDKDKSPPKILLNDLYSSQEVETLMKNLYDKDWYNKSKASKVLANIGTSKTLAKLIKNSEIVNYAHTFLLTRKLAIKFSKEKVPFIPVYPELLGKNFDL
jgi:HEAT repeat protein